MFCILASHLGGGNPPVLKLLCLQSCPLGEQSVNHIELKLFSSRLQAICDEMGGVLRRSAFSPNIKDRLDFSCALFAADGSLAAQAAHIPHTGIDGAALWKSHGEEGISRTDGGVVQSGTHLLGGSGMARPGGHWRSVP